MAADSWLRVEHDRERLYVELSGEDGKGPWTVLAVDRDTRRCSVAQDRTKAAATKAAATKAAATKAAAAALTAMLDD